MKRANLCSVALISMCVACGSDSNTDSITADEQTPPTSGRVDVESWISAAWYKSWTCEPTIHASRDPSPHGFNRICSNEVISAAATGTSVWPKGAAAVKELYTSATATAPAGYAVYLKTNADSAGGSNWYWYERVPNDSEAPHDSNGVVADGKGGGGTPKSICVGCHGGAGMDAAHTPSAGGRDQVYTPVH